MLRALVLFCLSLPAWACGPYRVSTPPYPTLMERDAQGQLQGVAVERTRLLAERSGCKLELQPDSVVRGWAAMQSGQVDILASMVRDAERERLAEFLVTSYQQPVLLLRRSQLAGWPTLAAFERDASQRIAVVKAMSFPPAVRAWIERLAGQGRVDEVGDMPTAFRRYEAGRVAALPIYPLAVGQRDAAWHETHALQPWFGRSAIEAGFAVSRRSVSAADRERLRAAVLDLQRDGSYPPLKRP